MPDDEAPAQPFVWFSKGKEKVDEAEQPQSSPSKQAGSPSKLTWEDSLPEKQRNSVTSQETMKLAINRALHVDGADDSSDPDALWKLAAQLGNLKSGGSRTANPIPRGRAVEAVDWLEELYKYICTSSVLGGDVTPLIRVPLTLVFRYTRPHVWYECRSEHGGGIRERLVKERTDEIIEKFRAAAEEGGCDILACYVYNKPVKGSDPESAIKQLSTHVEYFDLPLLRDFLRHRHREHDGILQQFCVPTGGRASCVRATATGSLANLRVKLESRVNVSALSDTRRAVRDRAVTFDGGEHESQRHDGKPKREPCRIWELAH